MNRLLLVSMFIFWFAGISAMAPVGIPGCTKVCPLIGFKNCGNTCWMDSGLQCLFNMSDLNDVVKTIPYPDGSLAKEYVNLFITYNKNVLTQEPLRKDNLTKFINKINEVSKFKPNEQNDAQEGMFVIINSLIDSDEKKVKPLLVIGMEKSKSFNNESFGDKILSQELLLPLPVESGYTVTMALNKYFSPEIIENYEMPDKSRKTITLSTKITHLSEYLIIQMKSLVFSTRQFKIKIAQNPELSLDMSSFVNKDIGKTFSTQYELQSVVAHHGGGFDTGHYIAFVHKDNQWYKCDDLVENIEKIEKPVVFDYEPYILIYRVISENKGVFDMGDSLIKLAESLQELAEKAQ